MDLVWEVSLSRFTLNVYLLTSQTGEYPASSTSASEAANQHSLKFRGPLFILVTNLPLSFGTPLAVIVFLIVFSACNQSHFSTVWVWYSVYLTTCTSILRTLSLTLWQRVCFGIGCILPLSVLYFRLKMLNSVLYRRGAIKRKVPYRLVFSYYWRSLIGTCGAWFLYDFVVRTICVKPLGL